MFGTFLRLFVTFELRGQCSIFIILISIVSSVLSFHFQIFSLHFILLLFPRFLFKMHVKIQPLLNSSSVYSDKNASRLKISVLRRNYSPCLWSFFSSLLVKFLNIYLECSITEVTIKKTIKRIFLLVIYQKKRLIKLKWKLLILL